MYFPLITIIIPVYNSQLTLDKCIDSILSQSFQDFEIILINDGSIDNSRELCEIWSNKDSRIRVLHQENKGPGAARNQGIKHSKGDWITFVDSDDYLDKSYLNNFCLGDCNYQLSIQGFERVDEKGYSLGETYSFENHYIKDISTISSDLLLKLFFYGQTCGKLYQTKTLIEKQIFFPENFRLSEDHCFYLDYLTSINCIKINEGIGYKYQMANNESLTQILRPFDELYQRKFIINKLTDRFFQRYNISNKEIREKINYFSVCGSINVLLRSLYNSHFTKNERLEKLELLLEDNAEIKYKYKPNSRGGKMLKIAFIFLSLNIIDKILWKIKKIL